MAKCMDIAAYIEQLAPCGLACEWDNVGLLVGDADKEVKRVLIALDNDENVTAEAVEKWADMIISHHPIMFTPINRITEADPQQRMLRRMCEAGICHYAAHTNMDCAKGGLNDYLAEKLGLADVSVIEDNGCGAGFGRVAELDKPVTLAEMICICENELNIEGVRYVGDPDRLISKVALNSGSGSDILGKCIDIGADVLITGDVKYTAAREAYEKGIAVIDAGHYGTEIIFTEFMRDYLGSKFSDVEFIISEANINVLRYHRG